MGCASEKPPDLAPGAPKPPPHLRGTSSGAPEKLDHLEQAAELEDAQRLDDADRLGVLRIVRPVTGSRTS